MREIKFRGKRKDNNEWIYGFVWKSIDPCKEKTEYRGSFIQTGTNIDIWYEVYPESIGENVGLPDKNGKKIYEGDICRTHGWHENKDGLTILSDKNKYYYNVVIEHRAKTPFCGYTIHDWFEIIGNIYENPELLK